MSNSASSGRMIDEDGTVINLADLLGGALTGETADIESFAPRSGRMIKEDGTIVNIVSAILEKLDSNSDGITTADIAAAVQDYFDKNPLSGISDGEVDLIYHSMIMCASNVDQVNALFADWWKLNWIDGESTRNEMLARWFGNVLYDDRTHGVKFPLFATSNTVIGELTDNSTGLVCVPSTASVAEQDDFAYLPQFWCVEVAMERFADGSHEIYYVEHIDDIADVRSGEYLCQVLQKNTYTREWKDESYHYMQMRCTVPDGESGWSTWPQGTDRNGNVYPYIANPKYYAGLNASGIPTCGTGLPPMNWTSHNTGVASWRKRGTQYSGACGNLIKWQLAMTWLKYARKGNSGTIEGCSSYNYQYTAAVGETGVERIILTTTQAANLFVGSSVQLGDKGTGTSVDRNTASMYKICRNKKITAIEDIEIDGVAYKAVYIDNGGMTFDTEAAITYISTDPYWSGWNDTVLGYDGSRYSPTTGKEPGLIQKTEFMIGSYIILSDELWKWGTDADGNYTFDCYTCHNQSKVTTNGTISSDYEKQDDLTLTFDVNESDGWKYIEDVAVAADRGVLWPAKVSTTAGSGTGVKAGFYLGKNASAVRAGWCCGPLNNAGNAGLPARPSTYGGMPYSTWAGSVGGPSGISG